MESFDIAIIGADGAGKSTFIQRVLGQPRPPMSNASNLRFVIDSTTHMITLLELDIESFELNTIQPIQWPKQINGHIVPRVDAALILYDVKDLATLRRVPRLLTCLTESGLPAMMAASKCDQPEDVWEIDINALANQKPFDQCQSHYRISMDSPESVKECLSAVIRAAIAHRKGAPERPTSEERHGRASWDFSLLRGMPRYRESLELDESNADRPTYSDIPILERSDDLMEKQPRVAGESFDDLVDRLLAVRLCKADHNFAEIFLCLYRKFAAPRDLFSAILTRLDRVRNDKTTPYMVSTMTQLRFIETLATWVALYPGDFARPSTRRTLDNLITQLFPMPTFNYAARQMRKNLIHNVHEDDDTGWAHADNANEGDNKELLSPELGELGDGVADLRLDDESLYGRQSGSLESGSGGSSTHVHLHNFDDYEREAARLEPTAHLPMNKSRFLVFMEISDDDVADELTRIEWVLFSSIRIRDFVRHVSLSASEREGCRSLKNVDRMINHFNHIAKWVANMILLRDKAKHRAQILEKFMNIALKLRQLNNYNGLAAVLAGISGTAIHRLAQTRALVSPDLQKKFARLGILMSTQKSHFAYRLAWENSPLPRIPFMPLYRRDLLSAEQGSKTFVGPRGDRINWGKFEILGEVLLPFMKSQGTPYPNLASNDQAREMILGCRMPTDEEEIYQRSLEVESSASGGATDPSKKMFPWFQNK
ncbi:Ras guanine nucleotide exchange factor A [Escovopsis weberi]|uniref:Ras guanine nucleotide exchange factor A n=1 Tax=Escovopsis weberi TaxID=150374 RepID=A0A0M9VWY4_ESCWE|nr:Ras guanine nucleotide exchange factor A [Escovopsis weberi]